ncbi:MAG: WD40 repeat domain-containing protein, partial [Gemmataceae bacterium]
DFAVTLTDDPDELQLKEANGLVNPNPLIVRRAGSAKPVPKKPVDAKPYPPAPPKGMVGLSDLKITKATFDPPGVEFTVRLHDEGGEFLEAWASVGIPNPAELVKTCAGAIDQGLLSVNGIDFANPDPALKVQRASLKKGSMPGEWIGTVKYPKAVLDDAAVDFGLAAALRLNNKIEKTNAAVIRLDLKTGAVIPPKAVPPSSRKEFRPKEVARFESTWWTDAGFSADGSRVLGLGADMQYSEWDLVRKERTYHKPGDKSFTSLAVSADFRQALAMERPNEKALGRLHLWDVREGKSIRSWEEPKGGWELYRPRAAFTPDGTRVAVLYREPSTKALPGGGFEFGGETKSQVFLFEVSSGKAVSPYAATSDTCLAFTPDGKQLLTDRYANIQVSDARTGVADRQFTGVPGFPTQAAMCSDGSYAAASCSRDSKYSVIVWEGGRNREVRQWKDFKTYVKFTFAPDNRTLLVMESGDRSKGLSGVIRAKDVPSDRALAYQELPKGLEFRQPVFSADGQRLVASAEDGSKGWVIVWDLEN